MSFKSDKSWVLAILVAALMVSATSIYLALQLSDRPDEARMIQLIDERLSSATSAPLSNEEFNQRVERGIEAYAEKQREARQQRPNQLAVNVPKPGENDHIYGNPAAMITLIEYSDFECPYCKRFHSTAKQLVDESDGQVNWAYRHFPLAFHNPGAQKQAEASECAAELGGNEMFWRYTDAIYERTRSNGKGFPIENLPPLAAEQGLDQEQFLQCLDSGRHSAKVLQQFAEGQRAGVNGTPGNILYHNRTGKVAAVGGAQPLERLRAAVQRLRDE